MCFHFFVGSRTVLEVDDGKKREQLVSSHHLLPTEPTTAEAAATAATTAATATTAETTTATKL